MFNHCGDRGSFQLGVLGWISTALKLVYDRENEIRRVRKIAIHTQSYGSVGSC